MIDVRRWEKLKRDVDDMQREVSRAEGSLSTLLKRLEDQFGCKTEEEGRKLLQKMERKQEKIEDQFKDALEEFEEKWKEIVERGD